MDPVNLAIAGAGLCGLAIVLLIHHCVKHGPGGGEELPYPDRCFQESDVFNFRTWNHETWIIFIMIAAIVLLVSSYAMGIKD